jgi:hypothetical protein
MTYTITRFVDAFGLPGFRCVIDWGGDAKETTWHGSRFAAQRHGEAMLAA